MRPSELGLPYDTYRPQQEEALSWLAQQTDKQVILLEAPPGVGKSLVGAAWAGLYGGGKGYILTRTLSLLSQYERTLDLPTVRGKANFTCDSISKRYQAHTPIDCEVGEAECQFRRSLCPYADQREVGLKSVVATTSYSYLLADDQARHASDYLVCDEGHNILDVITDWASLKIPLELDPPRDLLNLPLWANQTRRTIPEPTLEQFPAGEPFLRALSRWRRLDETLRTLSQADFRREPYVLSESRRSLVASPVWPDPSPLWRKRNLVMSATLYGGGLLADLFGLADGNWSFYQVPSPFDPARRPFYLTTFVALNARAGDEEYRQMARGIDWILQRHPNSKGLFHVSSYAQVKKLRSALPFVSSTRNPPILYHQDATKEQRTALFDRFRTAPAPCWLMSPSASEGEDFPYDQARINVIVKVPYPDLGDPLTAARKADGRRGSAYYAAITCGNLAQAYGRAMRSEDDWGLTYCLDSSIWNMLKFHRRFFPEYLLEATRTL